MSPALRTAKAHRENGRPVQSDGGRSAGRDGNVAGRSGDDRAVVLSASGLAKTYRSWLPFSPDVEVLDGASVELREGELVGIVGENGSGKSTLMRILVGALAADAGTVDRRGTIGWCPQEPILYDRLTVRETVDLFGEAYGLSAQRREERLDWLSDRLGFTAHLDTRIDRLSGGNRQKVNLSVALLHDPDVLLLDEPYTGFDWQTYLSFWELTEELVEAGTAIGIISHFVEDRDRFDRICALRDGRLERIEHGREPEERSTEGRSGPREGG